MAQQQILENTPLFILIAVITVLILVWRIKPGEFRATQWLNFCIAAGVFWGCFSLILVLTMWDRFYRHFAPPYYYFVALLASIFVYPIWSLALRWIALRLPGNPIVWFCILGGLQAIFEHAIAVYRLDLLAVPFLAGSTPTAIFIFSFFEYIVYWGIVVYLAVVIRRLRQRYWPVL